MPEISRRQHIDSTIHRDRDLVALWRDHAHRVASAPISQGLLNTLALLQGDVNKGIGMIRGADAVRTIPPPIKHAFTVWSENRGRERIGMFSAEIGLSGFEINNRDPTVLPDDGANGTRSDCERSPLTEYANLTGVFLGDAQTVLGTRIVRGDPGGLCVGFFGIFEPLQLE